MPAYFSILRIPQMMSLKSDGGMIYWQGKTEEPVPVPLFPPQILHGLTWALTRASAVRGRRITTGAMTRLKWGHNLYLGTGTSSSCVHIEDHLVLEVWLNAMCRFIWSSCLINVMTLSRLFKFNVTNGSKDERWANKGILTDKGTDRHSASIRNF
jgi:hypothetical protein